MRWSSTPRFLWTLLFSYWLVLTGLLLTPQPWRYFGSLQIPLQQMVQVSLADYIRHLLAFSLLALLARAARSAGDRPPTRLLLPALLVYALLTEVLQVLIPDRSFQWLDIIANTAGLLVGWNLPMLWSRSHRARGQL